MDGVEDGNNGNKKDPFRQVAWGCWQVLANEFGNHWGVLYTVDGYLYGFLVCTVDEAGSTNKRRREVTCWCQRRKNVVPFVASVTAMSMFPI